ncbi:hypothetical protein GJU40_11705 [Bacillus lacus]|uniref:Competence protein ComK n=1 Tax=Metabacillus lacus TaxID=1983721 RepID=A0A7X2IZT8_9BACI|nr:hypothetical protein [Metabacillus lacus]
MEYTIYKETIAIKPYYNSFGFLYSTVYEENQIVYVSASPKKIMKDNCWFHGGTFEGTTLNAKRIMRGNRLMPICLSAEYQLCMLPLTSPEKENCTWVSYLHARDHFQICEGKVSYNPGYENIELNVTPAILSNRIKHASQLLMTYLHRNEKFHLLNK